MAPRGWHGRGAQNRHYGPRRCRQDVLSSEGHRNARGRRHQGRLGRGQALGPDAPEEGPQSASSGYPPAGRRADPRSDDGESEPLALQDRETDEGRGPLRRRDICLAGIVAVVDWPFPIQVVKEGAARLLVPDVPRRKGPGTAGPWPFYNPTMTVNRDLAAIVLAKWPRRPHSVLDGLAATGAWGIRMQLEAGPYEITFNDRSTLAVNLIRENLRRNRIRGDVVTGELVSLLGTDQYDFVDIDPFGPPTPFLGALFEEIKHGSGLGVTATDTSVLSGTYPAACLRRYGARPLRCPQASEIGLRILLGFCERLAAKQSKEIRPILSFAAEHFLRIYATIDRRTGDSPLGFVKRRNRGEFIPTRADADAIGPLWLGPLHDAPFLRRLTPSAWTSVPAARLLSSLQREADLPAFFVTTDELAAREHGSPPKLDLFLDALRETGHRAERTHFHPRGVRTDAPFDTVLSVFRERMPSGSTDGSGPAN